MSFWKAIRAADGMQTKTESVKRDEREGEENKQETEER